MGSHPTCGPLTSSVHSTRGLARKAELLWRPTDPLRQRPAPGIVSGSLSLRGGASGLRGSTQKTDRSARAYTDVHDELRGQLVRQAGDCGSSFLQKNPADRAEETVHTSTMAWPETASQLSAAHRVKRLPVGTQPMGRTSVHGMTMPPSDLFRTL